MSLKGEAKKAYQKDYMRKRRGLTEGSNKYPSIIYQLVDPAKRAKLEAIVKSCDRALPAGGTIKPGASMLDHVMFLGIGITLRRVKELLEATVQ